MNTQALRLGQPRGGERPRTDRYLDLDVPQLRKTSAFVGVSVSLPALYVAVTDMRTTTYGPLIGRSAAASLRRKFACPAPGR